MIYTFPIYMTIEAPTKAAALDALECMLRYEKNFIKFDHVICNPINTPDVPTVRRPNENIKVETLKKEQTGT